MFKVKNKKTNEIIQVLATHCDEYGKAWFLIWERDAFRWRPSDNFVPPNYELKKKIIVAGSRNFQNYPLLCKEIDKVRDKIECIVSGDAKGADTLGCTYAYDNNIPVKHFPADWTKYGMAAGYIRNHEMGDYADELIAFWDGTSPGTKDMIDYMTKLNKKVVVINYNEIKKED